MWVLRSPQRATFIAAETEVKASVAEVWGAISKYDTYADVFRNVSRSSYDAGAGVLSIELGMQSVYWNAAASATLAVEEEDERVLERKQISFGLRGGDFRNLRGRWVVELRERTMLRLEVEVESKTKLPGAITNHIIRQAIPGNIKSLSKKVELTSLRTFADQALVEPYADIPGPNALGQFQSFVTGQSGVPQSSSPYQYLGVSEVPLPGSPAPPAPGDGGQTAEASGVGGVRIHLRKLDNDEYVHSRVIASVDIRADKMKVWKTLTDYDGLSAILPNLIHSKAIRTKSLPGRLKLRQIVVKEFMYLRFRAEAVLDVLEKPYNEIQFQLSNGTFDKFQGKFVLQSCRDGDDDREVEGATTLVYAVEIRIPRGIQTFAIDPLVEKFAFEDVANNVAVLKEHVESVAEDEDAGLDYDRPTTAVLCNDFEVLKAELRRTFGEGNATMPKKEDFRAAGRFDLEKACYAHGGFRVVAQKVGWRLAYRRKPKHYWDDFQNLRSEVLEFIQDHNLPPKEFPSRRTFIEYDRMDIVRAYTKWGGSAEVAELLDLRIKD